MSASKRRPTTDDPVFEQAWESYPRRPNDSKQAAKKAWDARVREGVDPQRMLAGVKRYAAYLKRERVSPRHTKQGATFFGPNCWFDDDYGETELPPSEREAQLQAFYERESLV